MDAISHRIALKSVFPFHRLAIPTVRSNSHDFEPLPVERKHFPPDETAAGSWVSVDQIGNAHDNVIYIR
jgi:hypothetical protein